MQIEKLETGIPTLDAALQGGIPKGHLVLVTGTPGVMKSSLTFQCIYKSALAGKHCAYVTLEQSAASILTQVKVMGYTFDKVLLDSNNSAVVNEFFDTKKKSARSGTISILDLGFERAKTKREKFSWLEAIQEELEKLKKRGLEVVVIDSLNVLYQIGDFAERRAEIYYLFDFFKKLDLTCFVIHELNASSEEPHHHTFESYLVDGIIRIVSVKRNLKMLRELNVEKMRFIDHSMNVFLFSFDAKKGVFKLTEKLAVD